MAIYAKKNRADIINAALRRLETSSGVRATGPGSVARAFAESITQEIGDLYDALDFNLAQSVVSSANGRALDLIGSLYNVNRRTLTDLASVNAETGSFYFYLDSASSQTIVIPSGTLVFSSGDSFVGTQMTFVTTQTAIIPAGRTKAYVSIRPNFSDSVFTAGVDTLTVHSFASPAGTIVRCTNPKQIAPQQGFETDDDYRVRIVKQIRVSASGTLEAVRFAALSIFGVRDVKIRSAPFGMGSFEIVVTPEDNSISQTVLANAVLAANLVRPVGVNMYASLPDVTPLDVAVSVITDGTLTSSETTNTGNGVRNAIIRYINTLLPGDTLVYNRLIQTVLDTSDNIRDVQITKYAPNGIETLRRNYLPAEKEQVIPGRIEVVIG